mmetsp:Transcript_37928/g.95338  ORF Transcript_37928/g.95338 Transcript_37928/m.95338 type:complete len:369 (-) Transcript_37928:1850-2956(-)
MQLAMARVGISELMRRSAGSGSAGTTLASTSPRNRRTRWSGAGTPTGGGHVSAGMRMGMPPENRVAWMGADRVMALMSCMCSASTRKGNAAPSERQCCSSMKTCSRESLRARHHTNSLYRRDARRLATTTLWLLAPATPPTALTTFATDAALHRRFTRYDTSGVVFTTVSCSATNASISSAAVSSHAGTHPNHHSSHSTTTLCTLRLSRPVLMWGTREERDGHRFRGCRSLDDRLHMAFTSLVLVLRCSILESRCRRSRADPSAFRVRDRVMASDAAMDRLTCVVMADGALVHRPTRMGAMSTTGLPVSMTLLRDGRPASHTESNTAMSLLRMSRHVMPLKAWPSVGDSVLRRQPDRFTVVCLDVSAI